MESREMIMPAAAPEAPYQLLGVSSSSTNTTTHAAAAAANPTQMMDVPSSLAKKKRGRPRKYGPADASRTLSPMPLSSAASPPSAGYSHIKFDEFQKKKRKIYSHLSLGEQITSGGSFTPHMVTVNPGEDVTSKIMSFSKYGPRAICVLSALGIISHVTLRQANSSGGTVTYEGRFEILSLSGSFTPGAGEVGGISSREGGMSIALSSPDGRVVGGLLGGLLTAAGPVQVVVASFLPDVNPVEPKPKNDLKLLTPVEADPTVPLSLNPEEQNLNELSQESPSTGNINSSPAPNSQHENRTPMPSVHDWRRSPTDMNVSLRED